MLNFIRDGSFGLMRTEKSDCTVKNFSKSEKVIELCKKVCYNIMYRMYGDWNVSENTVEFVFGGVL